MVIFKFDKQREETTTRQNDIYRTSQSDDFIIERSFENYRKYRPNISMLRDAFSATECGAEVGKFMSGIRLHVYGSGVAACSGR